MGSRRAEAPPLCKHLDRAAEQGRKWEAARMDLADSRSSNSMSPPRRKSDLAPWRTLPRFPSQLPQEATPHVQKCSPARARPALAGPPVLGHTPPRTSPAAALPPPPKPVPSAKPPFPTCYHILERMSLKYFLNPTAKNLEFPSLHLPSGCLQTSPWVPRLRPPPSLIHFPHHIPKAC